jgi:PIN domain nuclease of toxin-antitoxin system
MNLLLDTHTIIWFIGNNSRLPQRIREMLDDDSNDVYISVVSLWEISIKTRRGKLDLNKSLGDVVRISHANGFWFLPVHLEHIFRLDTMEFHHKDPFDRMLIAQSLEEDYALVSCDDAFDLYDVQRLW